MLLYGPPGTGKTMIAKAIAGELDATFFVISPAEILSKWVGEAERNIKKLFDAAKSEMLLYGDAADILQRKADRIAEVLDEIDPDLYRDDRFKDLDFTDWTIRRCNEARLAKAAQVPEQMAELIKNKRLLEATEKLRRAVSEFRETVEQLKP